ncbi:hypothetical protein ACWC24_08320 [Streptomyces sp. NPDC001443]
MARVPTHVAWQRRMLLGLFGLSAAVAVVVVLSAAVLAMKG